MNFIKDVRVSDGTSLQGYTETTMRKLIEVFGQPEYYGDGGDKVTVEWCLKFEDGTVATIYDWKRYELGTPELDELIHWNVGGFSPVALATVEYQMRVHSMSTVI